MGNSRFGYGCDLVSAIVLGVIRAAMSAFATFGPAKTRIHGPDLITHPFMHVHLALN